MLTKLTSEAAHALLAAKLSRRSFGLLGLASLAACHDDDDDGRELTLDSTSKAANADAYTGFEWYRWTFPIDPAIDTVGASDGIGEFYVRLFTPQTTPGTAYPLVANLGGLGNNGNMTNNVYARVGAALWTNAPFQTKYPAYVMAVTVPWEAAVNYEAEMVYMHEIGMAIRALADRLGNIDLSRIYATGLSQGAGWSYEVAAAQPDLYAALFINCGTVVHTTWGDQIDLNRLMDVNLYIVHGAQDTFIPPNEAYRVYNALRAKGKTNLRLDVVQGGHVVPGTDFLPIDFATFAPLTRVYAWQDWLFGQRKGVKAAGPTLNEPVPYAQYKWAGAQSLPDVPTWTTDVPYATRIETRDNPTWNAIKTTLARPLVAGSSSGSRVIGRFRIGDETQTTYDDPATATQGLTRGQVLCMTIQGYTGAYGDDLAAFNNEWEVDWAVMDGQVTSIALTTEASPTPIARPSTVNLTNGGGPNKNNSLATPNVLDGKQVYLKVSLADGYTSNRLRLHVRFIRKLGTGNFGTAEFASYWHTVNLPVA